MIDGGTAHRLKARSEVLSLPFLFFNYKKLFVYHRYRSKLRLRSLTQKGSPGGAENTSLGAEKPRADKVAFSGIESSRQDVFHA